MKKEEYSYFTCIFSMARLENLYIKEFIDYYKKLEIDKFYILEDNLENTEKVSDVLQDDIDNGYIEIIDNKDKNFNQINYFKYAYNKYKSKCNWLIFFDIDEFLEFVDKNMTIKKYLLQDKMNKCEIIKINWLIYFDNDLVYYDKRPVQERFTKPTYNTHDMKTAKSIVRGNLNETIWDKSSPHEPIQNFYRCDELGNKVNYNQGMMDTQHISYCYLKHFNTKSTEEYANKLKKGTCYHHEYDYQLMISNYFNNNKFTEEKLAIFEKILNRSFPQFHRKSNKNIKNN